MEFLNGILLGGLAAGSIPFLIYIFNRSRFRTQKWGAMHLLDAAIATNRRRIRLEQLLLLILRAMIPAVLALCMARPVITRMKNLIRNSKSSVVVMLDNSFSMEGGDNLRSNFTQATEETGKLVDNLPQGSQVAILGMAGPVSDREHSGYDLPQSRRVISAARGGFGIAGVGESMETAAGLFASRMHHADRQLVIVSDFQRASWGDDSATARRRAIELVNAATVKPRIVLMDVGIDIKENLAVQSIELSRAVIGVGQKVNIRANIRNYGKNSYSNLPVYFKVDGTGKSMSQINIGGRESAQVLFSASFETAGSHLLEVAVDADRLTADNTCRKSLPVLDRLPVLLVDGAPSEQPLAGETAFLEIALKPYGAAGSELKDMIDPEVVAYDRFDTKALDQPRVLVLANVPALDDGQLRAVRDFVHNGGGLMIFPGDKTNHRWYNDKLLADGRGLLPMRIASLAGDGDSDSAVTVVSQHYDHAALELFNDPRNGSLTGAQIRLWYRLAPMLDAAGKRAPARILARLDNGDPFLVERDFGHGRVLLCSTPADADWSNLPLRPFYLPLMQQLVTYLASKVNPPRNIRIGQRLAIFLPEKAAGRTALLTDPMGETHELPIVKRGTRGVGEFERTQQPGVYVLEPPDGEPIHYVVSTARHESDIESLTGDEIQQIAREMDAAVVHSFEEYRDIESSRRFGQEIWVGLLWLVLIVAFGELFLIQFFSRKKP